MGPKVEFTRLGEDTPPAELKIDFGGDPTMEDSMETGRGQDSLNGLGKGPEFMVWKFTEEGGQWRPQNPLLHSHQYLCRHTWYYHRFPMNLTHQISLRRRSSSESEGQCFHSYPADRKAPHQTC
ncbi:hypothetical protein L2E82_14962 [Cichorium intybus]|uniref:Uncharacterized protein n=1 Tax=Cichorium intybus TaxID=13427 RepID=A0ACB9F1H8_CICIN|nr:hypothetical protein L2E82_14962 [Cichorium intybus]